MYSILLFYSIITKTILHTYIYSIYSIITNTIKLYLFPSLPIKDLPFSLHFWLAPKFLTHFLVCDWIVRVLYLLPSEDLPLWSLFAPLKKPAL